MSQSQTKKSEQKSSSRSKQGKKEKKGKMSKRAKESADSRARSAKKGKKAAVRDVHHLYECSVQSTDADLDFAERTFKRRRGRKIGLLREDFCGTAALACTWVLRDEENRAIGVDLDGPTLDWGREHNVAALGEAAGRLELVQDDVRSVIRPRADVTLALNFSYWIFKDRDVLLDYFRAARRGLKRDGMLVLDLFGGTEAMMESKETRRIDADVTFDGTRVPAFRYEWEQAKYDPITGAFLCRIHFKLRDGTKLKNAFSYDWRFWTLPELRDLLLEAGFSEVEVYTDDWDDFLDDSNGIYRKRKTFDNEGVWVGYAVALR